MDILSAVWWGSTAGGVVAVIVAVVAPTRRRGGLVAAAVLFLVSGVLGILSIGLVFIVAAVACGIIAARDTRTRTDPASTRS